MKKLSLILLFLTTTGICQANVKHVDALEILQPYNEEIAISHFCDQFGVVMVEISKIGANPKSNYSQPWGWKYVNAHFNQYSKNNEITIPGFLIYYAAEVISRVPTLPAFKKKIKHPISNKKQMLIKSIGVEECFRTFNN